jgi:hypothetical protein
MRGVILFGLAAALGGVPAAAEEALVNGGFEAGKLKPWTTDYFVCDARGARAGKYGAWFYVADTGPFYGYVDCYLRQQLPRTYQPYEIERMEMWAYFSSTHEDGHFYLEISLGRNCKRFTSRKGEVKRGWNHVVFPQERIIHRANYVRAYYAQEADEENWRWSSFSAYGDDVSLTVTPAYAVQPTSLGRIRTLFR